MKQSISLSISSSLSFGLLLIMLVLSGCGTRPDTDICGVNGFGGYLRCYNLKRDYDDDGDRRSNAVPRIVNINSLSDLQGYTCTDPNGLANLKAYIRNMRNRYE